MKSPKLFAVVIRDIDRVTGVYVFDSLSRAQGMVQKLHEEPVTGVRVQMMVATDCMETTTPPSVARELRLKAASDEWFRACEAYATAVEKELA